MWHTHDRDLVAPLRSILIETVCGVQRANQLFSGIFRVVKDFPGERSLQVMTRECALAVSGSIARIFST